MEKKILCGSNPQHFKHESNPYVKILHGVWSTDTQSCHRSQLTQHSLTAWLTATMSIDKLTNLLMSEWCWAGR